MIRIFGKWLGIDIEINHSSFNIEFGLWYLFYFVYKWHGNVDMHNWTCSELRLSWKHIEIGMMK